MHTTANFDRKRSEGRWDRRAGKGRIGRDADTDLLMDQYIQPLSGLNVDMCGKGELRFLFDEKSRVVQVQGTQEIKFRSTRPIRSVLNP